jgi:hypothetical protein
LYFNRPPNALKPEETLSQERALLAGEESPPSPPSAGFDGDSDGGGSCFVTAAAAWAGPGALALVLAAGGWALAFRRRASRRR